MAEKIFQHFSTAWQTFLSIIKVILYSKWRTKVPSSFSNTKELVILANGPSLNKTIEESSVFLEDKTLMAVNFFAVSPLYEKLKPEIYLIADPLFWESEKISNRLYNQLVDKTTWKMIFFVPVKAKKRKEWQDLVAKNENIKVFEYNSTPIEGFQSFCNFVFKRRLGVPRPHNVLIPSISQGLNLPFENIYLAGADHSWLHDISVNEDNEIMMGHKHFYGKSNSAIDNVIDEDVKKRKLYSILFHMYVAFKSYFILDEYAVYLNKKVINITPDSFIDAFKRMKI